MREVGDALPYDTVFFLQKNSGRCIRPRNVLFLEKLRLAVFKFQIEFAEGFSVILSHK